MIDAYTGASQVPLRVPDHIQYSDPYVILQHHDDHTASVYSFSRPNQSEEVNELDVELWAPYSDTSLNEFDTYILEIHSTFKYKQFIQLFRGVSVWSLGKRLDGLSNQTFSPEAMSATVEYAYDLFRAHNDLRELYLNLPDSLMVTYQISLDYRTLCSLIMTSVRSGYSDYANLLGKEAEIDYPHWSQVGHDMSNLFELPDKAYDDDMSLTIVCPLFDIDKLITNSRSYIQSNLIEENPYGYTTTKGMLNDLYTLVIHDDPASLETVRNKLKKIRSIN